SRLESLIGRLRNHSSIYFDFNVIERSLRPLRDLLPVLRCHSLKVACVFSLKFLTQSFCGQCRMARSLHEILAKVFLCSTEFLGVGGCYDCRPTTEGLTELTHHARTAPYV